MCNSSNMFLLMSFPQLPFRWKIFGFQRSVTRPLELSCQTEKREQSPSQTLFLYKNGNNFDKYIWLLKNTILRDYISSFSLAFYTQLFFRNWCFPIWLAMQIIRAHIFRRWYFQRCLARFPTPQTNDTSNKSLVHLIKIKSVNLFSHLLYWRSYLPRMSMPSLCRFLNSETKLWKPKSTVVSVSYSQLRTVMFIENRSRDVR